ncbi:unnamed protein product [Linum trigynum]|uniref:CCHC-type domain-containing protein n=1 Tax=Linum trigynum TaxID=586398 RepID=A0AAV2D3A1_9ROSI
MADEIDEQLRSLCLTEEEAQGVQVERTDLDNGMDETIEELGLVGKLITPKDPNLATLLATMKQAWNLRRSFEIQRLEQSVYALQFYSFDDRKKFLYGGPRHFNRQPFIFRPVDRDKEPLEMDFTETEIWVRIKKLPRCMKTEAMAEKIANLIGTFIILDNHRSGVWSTSMRLRVSINVSKPLRRGILLENGDKKAWYRITYERLPNFCYICGILGHQQRTCPNPKAEDEEGSDEQYGKWLHASPLKQVSFVERTEADRMASLWSELRQTRVSGEIRLRKDARDTPELEDNQNGKPKAKIKLIDLLAGKKESPKKINEIEGMDLSEGNKEGEGFGSRDIRGKDVCVLQEEANEKVGRDEAELVSSKERAGIYGKTAGVNQESLSPARGKESALGPRKGELNWIGEAQIEIVTGL